MTALPVSRPRTHIVYGRIGPSPQRAHAAQAPRRQITVAGRFAAETANGEHATPGSLDSTAPQQWLDRTERRQGRRRRAALAYRSLI